MSNNSMSHELETVGVSELTDFFSNFSESQKNIEYALLMLEMSPDDMPLMLRLLDSIESIKATLHSVGLESVSPLTTSLVGVVQQIRYGHILFESGLSDLILLGVDSIKSVLEKMIEGENQVTLLTRLPRICESIDAISTTDEYHRDDVIKDSLLLLDPSIEIVDGHFSTGASIVNLFSKNMPDKNELSAYGVEEDSDFIFFRSLSEPLEMRANYWHGRVPRMLRLALKMNDEAGRLVNPNQLAAAIYMHDAGMALLPLEIINSKGVLSDEQREQVQQHPIVGYELMRYMKSWREASFIVLQHHEKVDGSGYPYGLKEEDICDGAKILAIVDAVDARTHERAHANLLKRPLLRAAIELGQHAGVQFSEKWVDIFKVVFQALRKADAS